VQHRYSQQDLRDDWGPGAEGESHLVDSELLKHLVSPSHRHQRRHQDQAAQGSRVQERRLSQSLRRQVRPRQRLRQCH
jgi:hypothetical protein